MRCLARARGARFAGARAGERRGTRRPTCRPRLEVGESWILKGFLTEAGKEAADLGIQASGGHGFIRDNGAEQVYRDARIASLWEGTTQIQALDKGGELLDADRLSKPNTAVYNSTPRRARLLTGRSKGY